MVVWGFEIGDRHLRFRRFCIKIIIKGIQKSEITDCDTGGCGMWATSLPSARLASSLAVSKAVVERPILNSIQPEPAETSSEILNQATWNELSRLYQNDARLDKNSITLIEDKKLPNTTDKNNLSRVIRNFETVMALDTVKNEYLLHRQIHQWFLAENQTSNINQLNEKVYAELFLTPSSDPWLGLVNNDTYSAIDNGGIVEKN